MAVLQFEANIVEDAQAQAAKKKKKKKKKVTKKLNGVDGDEYGQETDSLLQGGANGQNDEEQEALLRQQMEAEEIRR